MLLKIIAFLIFYWCCSRSHNRKKKLGSGKKKTTGSAPRVLLTFRGGNKRCGSENNLFLAGPRAELFIWLRITYKKRLEH